MEKNTVHHRSRSGGALKVWLIVVIAALALVIAVITIQVLEYLFYEAPPSVWPSTDGKPAPEAAMQPLTLKESTVQTNEKLDEKTVE